ncbi:MAG: tyrosine-type recombinase/integrase [Eubacteriales bacterium]|nr:tyrosine-type recombinase/integrase [Eubacteriales bacterium]
MTLSVALEKFLDYKTASGLASSSVNEYQRTISLFIRFVSENTDVSAIDWEMVQTYLKSLYNGRLAYATARSYTKDLKIFIRWLDGEYRLPFPASKIKVPKARKKDRTIYSVDEIKLIFGACDTYIPFVSARNRAIISLLFDCGLRRNEVTKIRLSDIHKPQGDVFMLTVHGKGGKDRTVPLNLFTRQMISNYMDICPYHITDYIFLTKTGTPISNDTISQAFTDMQKKLPFELSAHKLRHNFATNYCIHSLDTKGYVDLFSLSIIMGHEDISTTRIYEHLARENMIARNFYSFMDEKFLNEKSICLGNVENSSAENLNEKQTAFLLGV